MTLEEFHALPRRPGWKQEYWGGKAYIQPRPSVAFVRAPITLRPVLVPDGFRLPARDTRRRAAPHLRLL